MHIGVLALQGDFAAHQRQLARLGAESRQIRRAADLRGIRGQVMPGGESTALLKLLDKVLRLALRQAVAEGLPTLSTCAGTILLAQEVVQPAQESLALLDITVMRNAYGRQVDSFIEKSLEWTALGKALLTSPPNGVNEGAGMEGIFIRAPRIIRTGGAVEVLLKRATDPVLVRQGHILAATFHPELSEGGQVHALFLQCMCK